MSTAAVTSLKDLKQNLMWGTYGKGGVEHCAGRCPEHKLQWVKLIERESDHLQAILRTQRQIVGTQYDRAIRSILMDRGVTPERYSYEAEQELFAKMRVGEKAYYAGLKCDSSK